MALYNSVKPIKTNLLIILINIFLIEATFTNEKKALLSFKQDLVDPMNMLASWVANGDDCCKWAGVLCDNTTGHVQQLLLANHLHDQTAALSGKVNPSLLNLSYLTHLDLSYNNFGGIQIPSFFGSLKSLKYLNLTQAGFEGRIPHQLGNLSSLSYLVLQSNYDDVYSSGDLYADNLNWVSSLSALEYLEMKANLSAATDWLLSINKLPSLLELHMPLCEFSNIHPISHVNFSSLEVLDISENEFQSSLIPDWIFNLTKLVHLDLGKSYFQGSLPSSSKSLSSLKYIDLSQCYLVSLPDWFFNLENMAHLTLSENAFDDSIMCRFHNMTFLKELDLSGNYFSSSIPNCVYSYDSLEYLSLRFNELHGVISSSIQNLTSLVNLDWSHNALEGKIPASMGNLCNLQIIWLNNNKLVGEISETLESSFGCDPNRLTTLSLDDNLFSGELKDDIIEKFQSLTVFGVKGNMISGPIPSSIGKLSALGYLSIGGNHFNGSLPETIGSLSSLHALHIFDNLLQGNVTEIHFANLTKLIDFYASGNSLVLSVKPDWIPPFRISTLDLRYWSLGPQFPRWLESQKHFHHLDLSQTGISDSIPSWFWNLSTTFSYLNLSHNQIKGRVPDMHFNLIPSMIYLSSNKFEGPLPRISSFVAELDLSNNSFTGEISNLLCTQPNIGATNSLSILHLGRNSLSGKIPDCWKYWPSLKMINLSNNNLTGKIPSSIGSLQNLQSLHLRNNSLSGGLPISLQSCTMLLVMDLSLNEIVGSLPTWIGLNLPTLMILNLRSNQLSGQIPFELCLLGKLQILDIAHNKLFGAIPGCFENFRSMVTRPNSSDPILYSTYPGGFLENALVVSRGREDEYNTILSLVTSLDLSSNNLSGNFPIELTNLQGLYFLNLSRNSLKGTIPNEIRNMVMLESLDLSMNQFSGSIPPGMTSLNFLNHLNLSYNNLLGKIPVSTQMQSMDGSSFIGNQLCGLPLEKCRDSHETTAKVADNEDKEEKFWFRLGIAVGFGVGFVGIIGPLLVCGFWRRAYFWFFNEFLWYKIYDCYIKVRFMFR